MIGLLVNDMEKMEIEYLVRREMEELLMDLDDHRIDQVIKHSMKERYSLLFKLFQRVASEKDCFKYMPKRSKYE
ncbi:hypothetical protein [Virgibacillus sp. DJP39]|uniref:hypothetical protein n=1 Tax=Virgibacillus sp. DJP39 TaxID=3409790 RepID=UPI003BB7D05A